MVLIIIWLFFMLCCMTGAIDTPVIQFLFVLFLVVTTSCGLFCYVIVSEDERKEAKEKKAQLRHEKFIQKEKIQRQKWQAKENRRRRHKDEKESQERQRKKRRRQNKERKQEKKSQRQALRQARKDFFIYRRLIEKEDKKNIKLQKKLQKELNRYDRKEVMITQTVHCCSKIKRDKSKSIKLTSFILPVIVFIVMTGCIFSPVIGFQIIFAQNQNNYTQVITDYCHIDYNDSS